MTFFEKNSKLEKWKNGVGKIVRMPRTRSLSPSIAEGSGVYQSDPGSQPQGPRGGSPKRGARSVNITVRQPTEQKRQWWTLGHRTAFA